MIEEINKKLDILELEKIKEILPSFAVRQFLNHYFSLIL